MPIQKAIVETLNQAFPTIVTSGSMLVAAGFIISNVSSNAVVAAIGLALGRGTLTSIALVLLALPQTLLIGDIIIEKTAFTLKRETIKPLPTGGRIRMTGHIKGYVNGVIDGEFSGVIDGEMGAWCGRRTAWSSFGNIKWRPGRRSPGWRWRTETPGSLGKTCRREKQRKTCGGPMA